MPTQPGPYGVRNVVSIRASRLSASGARICPNPHASAGMPRCVAGLGGTRTRGAGPRRPAAPPSYVHKGAFLTPWRLGDESFGEGATNIPLLGKGQANNSIVKGSFDDIPVDAQGDGFTARWLGTDLPDAGSAPYSTAPAGGWLDPPACTAS